MTSDAPPESERLPPDPEPEPGPHAARGPWIELLHRLVWPLAFVAVAVLVVGVVRERTPGEGTGVRVEHPTPSIVAELRTLARLESVTLRLEKIVDLRDHQRRLFGLVETEDGLLFVASGEVVLGVDLGRLREGDVRVDAAANDVKVVLPEPEVLSTRLDEAGSYVHTRNTGALATRNEALESLARKEAVASFEAAGRDPKHLERARAQAERTVVALLSVGGRRVTVSFRPLAPEERAPRTP